MHGANHSWQLPCLHEQLLWWDNNHSVRGYAGKTVVENIKKEWANVLRTGCIFPCKSPSSYPESLWKASLSNNVPHRQTLGQVVSLQVKENTFFGNSTWVECVFCVSLWVARACLHDSLVVTVLRKENCIAAPPDSHAERLCRQTSGLTPVITYLEKILHKGILCMNGLEE